MRLIVAVSGGVDSVVLLDKLVRAKNHDTLIVAHFDHGIRPDSAADARFVAGLAAKYNLEFEGRREELGKDASEALARERRYAFLRELAKKHNATITTAHHQDDLIETIAINLQRGTGWRGLAVLNNKEISRPLLGDRKQQLYDYALLHDLEWVEDETNNSDAYLRNRTRRKLNKCLSNDTRIALVDIWRRQLDLRAKIDDEDSKILGDVRVFSRYFFTHIDEAVANELLRTGLQFNVTRPQVSRLLQAIKTAKSGTSVEVGAGHTIRFTVRDFIVETP